VQPMCVQIALNATTLPAVGWQTRSLADPSPVADTAPPTGIEASRASTGSAGDLCAFGALVVGAAVAVVAGAVVVVVVVAAVVVAVGAAVVGAVLVASALVGPDVDPELPQATSNRPPPAAAEAPTRR
jgi:hypothetical protein